MNNLPNNNFIETQFTNYNFNNLPKKLKTFEFLDYLPEHTTYFSHLPTSLNAIKFSTSLINDSLDFLPFGLKYLCLNGMYSGELYNLQELLEILDIRSKYFKIMTKLQQSIKIIIVYDTQFYQKMTKLYGKKVKKINNYEWSNEKILGE